jgi:transcriptional regulator with XRE-family HTH domain
MLTKFGVICRDLRASKGLYLVDQAEATGISVSTISAIERGVRNVPEGYVGILAKWHMLSLEQTSELAAAVAQSSNVIKFRPKSEKAASLAFAITRRLNELTADQMDEIRRKLEEGVKVYE